MWKSRILTSPQLVQVNLRVPRLRGLQRLFPSDLASRIRGSAGHDARKGGFRALVRLIVEMAAGDTFNERFLLLPVRKFQVRSELSCCGKRRLPGVLCGSALSQPGLVSPDAERASVRGLRSPFRPKESLRHFPPALGKLRRTKRDVNSLRIMEQHVVVAIDVSVGGTPGAPAARRSFQRMRFQNPVANVDAVNVLFHDDVAGKDPVIHPIAKAAFDRRSLWPGRPIEE